ncbi:MAG: G8 domain-containing protein [Trueperaceae bacterium]
MVLRRLSYLILLFLIGCQSGSLDTLLITPQTPTLKPGESRLFKAKMPDGRGEVSDVAWESSDTTVASISKFGLVTAKAIGQSNISASGAGAEGSVMLNVSADTPTPSSLNIQIQPETLTLDIGGSADLNATITQNGAPAEATLEWLSEDNSVATVEGGKVTALKVGTTKIQAQTDTAQSNLVTVTVVERSALWSDPATWGGVVPTADQNVTIPRDKRILLDVSTPDLKGIVIEGVLAFANQDLELTADWIMVHGGSLEIGSTTAPFTNRTTITLNGPKEDVLGMNMGGRLIGVMMGGKMAMHGEPRTSWTKLNRTANVGETTLELLEAPNWRVGDQIIVASTDFDFNQAETFSITAINDKTVTLDKPLKFMHWGTTETFNGKVVDQRAEVGLLTRNITVQSAADTLATNEGFGGHIMVMDGEAYVDGVSLKNMGQTGIMGRYPIHWHLMADKSQGQYIQNSSIVDSFSRCVTVHGSNGVTVKNNVAANTLGHCFFLEDGAEFDNVLEGNLGLGIKIPAEDKRLLPTDASPAVYWITNPQNTLRNNVAAGSQGFGFWYALPEHPTGPSAATNTAVNLRHIPLKEFVANVSHSNSRDGLMVDNGPQADVTLGTEVSRYDPRDNADPKGADVPAIFDRLTAYKNRNRGVWLRGENHVLQSPILADNAIGSTFASEESFTSDGLYVGETNNIGTPKKGEARAYPKNAEYALRGFEFYDGRVGVENSYFANYIDTATRKASAFSYLDFTGFNTSSLNYAKNVSFAANTKKVNLFTRTDPVNPSDGSEDGYRTAVILDTDGTVTGKAGNYVVADNSFLLTNNCSKDTTWNAWICDEDYANFNVEAPTELNSLSISRAGQTHTMYGQGSSPSKVFRTRVLANATYSLGTVAGQFILDLRNMVAPIQVAIPLAAKPTRLSNSTEVASLAAVQSATVSSHFYDGSTLHVKLVSNPQTQAVRVTVVP